MYDRAPRSLNNIVGCTPDHIGPGSYLHRPKKISAEGYAPFLSLSNRSEVFSNSEIPGPGYYDFPSPKIKVK
ncbi:unnamed protein product [Adineta steineri]|uniref:Uncharacterized protein n=1 Tax=Adineta steineri TaxID=433720 RepID=A0A813YR29_9BILA|nr:unnamed protein product [Adineta steineri]CAF0884934.1 unnamed protein product [Adineta steineri]CAF0888408.1 unnamed protein product [Adineta steineri]